MLTNEVSYKQLSSELISFAVPQIIDTESLKALISLNHKSAILMAQRVIETYLEQKEPPRRISRAPLHCSIQK